MERLSTTECTYLPTYWHDSGLQDSTKHFMCTRLDEMELVRNLGHRS